MTKTIDCIACGAPVPYGRLSCQACGALLASVGGRPSVATRPIDTTPESLPQPYLLPDDEDDQPTIWASHPVGATDDPTPTLAGRPYRLSKVGEPIAAALGAVPGAYQPAGTGPIAAAAVVLTAPAAAPVTATAARPATDDQRGATTADPTRMAEIAGWFVVVGATMTVLGFLLPWSQVVIGARSTGSWLDSWGLASPGHVVLLAATMVVLALGVIRSAVPAWVRSGVLPLALGSLLIGLVWPYQVGPLGADVGVTVVGLGALALVIGGVVTTWATRHVDIDPRV